MIPSRLHPRVDEAELDRAERQRRPAGLIGERAVVDERVECQPEREHQSDELDRPPALEQQRDDERRQRRDEA